MEYRKVCSAQNEQGSEAEEISYEVYDGETLAARFRYHIQKVREEDVSRFWIDAVHMTDTGDSAATMEAVLHFIQYKCQSAGCSAMLVRLDQKNLFEQELYCRFGFYLIDQEEQERSRGQRSCVNVLKYPLPATKDEMLRNHILRSERKRAGKQPDA